MNLEGSPGKSGNYRNVSRRRADGQEPRSTCVSPDRDIDLRRRFEALKGDLTVATANASPGDSHHKQPLTLADIQGSIAKRHTSDLANAQRKWIESLNLQTPVDSGTSEEDAQKEWINHISVTRISDRPSRRDVQTVRRSSDKGFEHRSSIPSPKSSSATSPHKVPRNLTVRSAVLTPGAPTFGFCDVPHLTINSLPVTATSVKEVVKPDKEFVTESGKIIKMLKLEEPPKIEKKLKGRSPQKMKAVIDLDPTKQENRSNKTKDASKPQRIFRASLSPKKTKHYPDVPSSLSPDAVEKYKLSFNREHAKDHVKSSRSKSEHKSPRKLKRSSSLPGGLFKEKLESDAASKHARNYDVKETRCFIKQKQKEREERMAEEKRKKAIEAEERKQKMQQLKDTQRKIMQKIKKRTVNKIRSPLPIQKDSDKPKWVGPLETTSSALDTSLELVHPKPKTPVLSEAAMGTITLKKRNPQPVHEETGDHQKMQSVGTVTEFVVEPPPSMSVATCTSTDEPAVWDANGSSKHIFKDFCLKDLEVASDQSLHLKRPAPQLVETSTQIDFDDKSLIKKHKTGRTSSHSSGKGPKHTLPPEIINKENLGTSDININDLPYSSRLDKFLAEYVPTPKKNDKTSHQPQTPQWLQEMSQYPDQFNLINTLNKALKRQQKLESSAKIPTSKPENSPSKAAKLHESGCSLNQLDRETLSAPRSRVSSSDSSSRQNELYLDPPEISLIDDRLSSSSLASSSAHSFEKYKRMAPNNGFCEKNDDIDVSGMHKLNACNMTAVAGDVTTTELSVLFPQTSGKLARDTIGKRDIAGGNVNGPTIEILGEKILEPKGAITIRKPLGRRTKVELLQPPPIDLSSSIHEFVNTKRGSDPSNLPRAIDLSPVTTPEVPRSHSTSFSSKEGSYHLPASETRSEDTKNTFEVLPETSYQRFVRNIHGPQSEHSSDSVSEIVKVSRTVSRGSTVISEEVSEMQNTLSVSTKSLKFNSSSIQNQIKNEIEQLDRVNQSLSSFMESGKMVLSREMTSASVVQSESAVEPLSQDVVTVKPKAPVLMDDIESSMFAVSKNVLHSREPSGSGLDISLASANGIDVTKLTVEMFDNLIKDEKLRSEQLVSGLKLRMKGLCNRTRKDLETIESQRKKLIEGGHEEEARELKRKQRGHIMKMNEEIEEMQRQRAMENKACQERCMLLKQQQQLIKLLLHSRRESSARNSRSSLKSLHMSQLDETVRYVGSERNSDIIDRKKREYREKEEALRERKKNVEAIVAWKKRLELEEKSVREMEKMIAQSSFTAPLPETVVERGTSPCTEIKDCTVEEAKAPKSRIPASATSQSESEHQNKDYYSDSFEHSSVLSEAAGMMTPGLTQGSSLLNKAMKMPMLKVPLAPRVTIIKRRHSSGSDESMLLSQNDTLSEQSDVEVRVSALEQQLRHRKSELAKLKREYQKNQKERLRSTEKNLINQIHLYDSYIEQVKTEIKDLENSDVKVTKPQIKQPKFLERRQSDKFVVKSISKESSDVDVTDAKNNETSLASEDVSHDASVLFLDKAHVVEEKVVESQNEKIVDSCEVTEKLDQGTFSTEKEVLEEIASDTADYDGFSGIEFSGVSTDPVLKAAMDKVKIKSMEPFRDSESSVSDKDFSIEEIIEKAEQSQLIDSSEEVHTQNGVTEATMSDIVTDNAKMDKMSVLEEVEESLATQSQISESLDILSVNETSPSQLEHPVKESLTDTLPRLQAASRGREIDFLSVQNQDNSKTTNSISEDISRSVVGEVIKTISDAKSVQESSNVNKSSESGELKAVSEETLRDVYQSKTSINGTVNTVSEQVRIPSAFSKYVSDRSKNRDSRTGTSISENLPSEVALETSTVSPVLEQATDIELSPKLLSGSGSFPFEVDVEDIHSLTFSPQRSPEIPSATHTSGLSSNVDVSEQIQSAQSGSARVSSSGDVGSHQVDSSAKESSKVEDRLEDESQELQHSGMVQRVTSSPATASGSELSSRLEKSGQISVSTKSNPSQVSSRSARKRLDMDVYCVSSDSKVKSVSKKLNDDKSGYQPTMEIEGGKRSISELIQSFEGSSKGSSDGSSVSEQIPTDQGSDVVEEKETACKSEEESEIIEQVEEEELVISETSKVQSENSSSAKDDLDKLDFSLGSLDPYRPQVESAKDSSGKAHSEAGDSISVKLLNELLEDKKEQGQGDEPLRDLEIQSIEADSLEDPFGQDFNSSFNAEEFAKYFESSFEKEPDLKLAPSKPLSEVAVIQLLQDSFELSDKIWEENLAMKKSSEETPLLSALQRERQQNVNVDSISQLIFESFLDDATSAALMAYSKKQLRCSSQTGHENKDAELSPNKEVGDNEKFWLGDDFTLQAAHEAEQLRLRELQIQQEIEQLEQAQEVVPYYYVREIPNKPPPPYTPPKPAPPSKEETVSRVLQGGEILWDIEMSGGDPSEAEMPSSFLPSLQDDPYRMFLFDLAKELYLKVKPRPSSPVPPWVVSKRRGKPLPPIRTKGDLLKYLEKEIKLAFGFNPRILRESLIMKWTRKRRDHVDEILVRELQESEAEWRDFTVEENIIKNRIAESLITDAIDEAVSGLSKAFTNKFKDLTVDQS